MIDNRLMRGNPLNIDIDSITWKRVVDMNDRALRQIIVGLGGKVEGGVIRAARRRPLSRVLRGPRRAPAAGRQKKEKTRR